MSKKDDLTLYKVLKSMTCDLINDAADYELGRSNGTVAFKSTSELYYDMIGRLEILLNMFSNKRTQADDLPF